MKLLILILILPILLKAIEDGFYLRGWKKLSHVLAVMVVMSWFGIITKINFSPIEWYELFWLGILYISLRILLFRIIHNIAAGLPLFYYGKTTYFWDKFESNHSGWLFIMSLGISIGIIVKLVYGIY